MTSVTPDLSHEVQLLQLRVDDLDVAVRQLRQEVALSAPGDTAPPVSPELLDFAKKSAIELGFEIVGLERVADPDTKQSDFYSLDVQSRGTPQELLELQSRWHEQLYQFDNSYIGHLSLCVFPIS